jgi:hypothetical protein
VILKVLGIVNIIKFEEFCLLGYNAEQSGKSTDVSEEHIDSTFRVEE